jgi:hypothetical protein
MNKTIAAPLASLRQCAAPPSDQTWHSRALEYEFRATDSTEELAALIVGSRCRIARRFTRPRDQAVASARIDLAASVGGE